MNTFLFQVNNKTTQEIDFTSAKTQKKQMDQAIAMVEPVKVLKQRKLPDISEPSSTELSTFFAALDKLVKGLSFFR